MFTTPILVSSLLAAQALAQTAHIVIEASQGGAGNSFRNTSIDVPVNTLYTNASAFDEISTIFLTRADGTPVEGISCTPYRNEDGTDIAGETFSLSNPGLLSTDTVQIGSIRCLTRGGGDDSGLPPAQPPGFGLSTTSPPPALVTEVPGGLAMGPSQTVVDGTTTYAGPGITFETDAVPLSTVTQSASQGVGGGSEDEGSTTMTTSTTAVSSASDTEFVDPVQQTDGAAGHVTPGSGLAGILAAAIGLGVAL